MQARAFFQIPRCCMKIGTNFVYMVNGASQALRWKLSSRPSQRNILKRKVSGAWQSNYSTLKWLTRVDSASRQECFQWSVKPMRLVPHEHVTTFLPLTGEVGIASRRNISSVLCPLRATPLTWYIKNLCRLRTLLERPQKNSYCKAHLETVILVCLRHASNVFALYWQGKIDLSRVCESNFFSTWKERKCEGQKQLGQHQICNKTSDPMLKHQKW